MEQTHDQVKIRSVVIDILQDMTSDWDMDSDEAIGSQTRLIAELEFESIDVVELIVAIEQKFGTQGLPFEKLLMEDGRYVDEIVVEQIVQFLSEHL